MLPISLRGVLSLITPPSEEDWKVLAQRDGAWREIQRRSLSGGVGAAVRPHNPPAGGTIGGKNDEKMTPKP